MSLPPLVFFSLTPEEEEDVSYIEDESKQDVRTWIEDSECQENLFHILSLAPEETIIDKDNRIHTTCKLFFEELGYLTEEPEPIDPTRDYEAEAKELFNQRNCIKTRQKHIELEPSLDNSLSPSSVYCQDDIRLTTSPLCHYKANDHHFPVVKETSPTFYHYHSSQLQTC